MSPKRAIAPIILTVSAAIVAVACGPVTASGVPSSSATAPSPAASASAPASSAPAASASAGASASASAAASAGTGTGSDPAALIPTTVGDVQVSVTQVDGASYVTANVSRQLGPILTALGKAPTDVTVASGTGAAAGGATLFIDAVAVDGADAEALVAAFQTAAEAAPGTTVEPIEAGGRPAVQVTTASSTLAVTAEGDTLLYVQSPDPALVTAALEAIPPAAS